MFQDGSGGLTLIDSTMNQQAAHQYDLERRSTVTVNRGHQLVLPRAPGGGTLRPIIGPRTAATHPGLTSKNIYASANLPQGLQTAPEPIESLICCEKRTSHPGSPKTEPTLASKPWSPRQPERAVVNPSGDCAFPPVYF